jgi:hypothetical protein
LKVEDIKMSADSLNSHQEMICELCETVYKKEFWFLKHRETCSGKKKRKANISTSLKKQVWTKYVGLDRGEVPCLCCGCTKISMIDFHCGYYISEKNGGKIEVENLRPICAQCNLNMSSKNFEEFRKGFSNGIIPPEKGENSVLKLAKLKKKVQFLDDKIKYSSDCLSNGGGMMLYHRIREVARSYPDPGRIYWLLCEIGNGTLFIFGNTLASFDGNPRISADEFTNVVEYCYELLS